MTVNEDAIALKEQCETQLRELNKTKVTVLESAIRALDEVLERDDVLPTDRATGERFTPARVIEVVTKQTARTLALMP